MSPRRHLSAVKDPDRGTDNGGDNGGFEGRLQKIESRLDRIETHLEHVAAREDIENVSGNMLRLEKTLAERISGIEKQIVERSAAVENLILRRETSLLKWIVGTLISFVGALAVVARVV